MSSSWRNYSHDARGNVAADGIHCFGYDYANQPTSVSGADVDKCIPESQLGPSGHPKQHTVEYSSRKSAKQTAAAQTPSGGRVKNDANPANPNQGPHFQAENAKGENVKPVVHHERPDP